MKKHLIPLFLVACLLLTMTACKKDKDEDKKKTQLPDTFNEIILAYDNMAEIEVHVEEKLKFSKKIDGEHWNMQGGDNDGTFGYFAINDGGAAGESLTRIYKIDLETWETVKISEDMSLGHANDVTYIPGDHQLMITACESLTADTAYVVDADTLEMVSSVVFPKDHANMCYSPERQQYVLGFWETPKEVTIYDNDLEHVLTISCMSGHAHQSLECDENFIYYLQSPNVKGANEGYIFVYSWEGELVQYIDRKSVV